MSDGLRTERPSWDETWMEMARFISYRSLCSRDQVGVVISSESNRVVAVGYNNPPAGFDHQGRICRAWCPRTRDSRKIVGYEYDNANPFAHEHQLTNWSISPFEQTVEVDGNVTYVVKEQDPDFARIMESCGWYPVYEEGDTSTTNDLPCHSLHAESNAISVCDRDQREGGTIYITSAPCFNCAKLIANSGLSRVVYRISERGSERINREKTNPITFMVKCGIEVISVGY